MALSPASGVLGPENTVSRRDAEAQRKAINATPKDCPVFLSVPGVSAGEKHSGARCQENMTV